MPAAIPILPSLIVLKVGAGEKSSKVKQMCPSGSECGGR